MKKIYLRGKYSNKFVLIDDENYNWLNKHKWYFEKGYAIRIYQQKNKIFKIRMHRQILNTPEGLYTDHINRNKLDNRKKNLRFATRQQNSANRTANRKKIKSNNPYKGVHKEPRNKNKKWIARIWFYNNHIYLGGFHTKIEAAKAYDVKAKELFGEYACLNFN